MSNISLLKAFSILRSGSDYQIGEGHHWKRGVLNLAIGLVVIFPLLNFWRSQFYAGAVPPEALLIRGVGNFTIGNYNSRGITRKYNINFKTNDGKIFYVIDNAISAEKIRKFNSEFNLQVEGFLLQDGRGLFWPTLIITSDGHVLLSRMESSRILNNQRRPFGELLLLEYGSTIPLWLISLSNAIKLRKKFPEIIK
ncbi:hypothetical protein ACAX43_07795 [Paraburkholderia sp. IW21]